MLEAWRKQQSQPKMEQPVELASPFPQLHFSIFCIFSSVLCSLTSDSWNVCHFLTWQLYLTIRNFLLRHLNWSLTSNTREKMSSNASHHFITARQSSLRTVHINSLFPWNLCLMYLQKCHSTSEIYRTFAYLLAKHHLGWGFATKSYCSFMKLSIDTWRLF